MSKNFLLDLCLWSWGRQARQGRLSVAQSGATITSASPDNHLTGGVDDPIFRLKTGVQIVGGVLAILSGVLLVLFFAKLDEVGTTCMEAVQIIKIEYFFKAEMHTHRTKTNKKTTQREL